MGYGRDPTDIGFDSRLLLCLRRIRRYSKPVTALILMRKISPVKI